jgi:cytochrome oxidase Cu insertion factor (SCO1/SenC/PrrC family)
MSSFFDTDPDWADPAPRRNRRHPRSHRRRWIGGTIALALLAVIVARAAVLATRHARRAVASVASTTGATDGANSASGTQSALPADATFTAADGRVVSLAAGQGKPVVLWFIGASCSSCGVSVPVVAKHLPEIAANGVHVVAVDLYGDLPGAPRGLKYLREFGKATAGAKFTDASWTWGLASEQLSYRYDPTGTPDLYFVIDRDGQITYRGSVPVSTMSSLLDHIRQVGTTSERTAATGSRS